MLVFVSCSVMSDSEISWTIAHQTLSMEFPRQEYWSGLLFPSPGDVPDPGIKPRSPTLQADSLRSKAPEWRTNIPVEEHASGIKDRNLRRYRGCWDKNSTLDMLTSRWLSWWLRGKQPTCQCRRHGFDPWVEKSPWRRIWQPTPVFLPRKSHGLRNQVGLQPMGLQKSQTWLSN